ncbi:hypothetical protein MTR67_044855 [Solanum verrucosum]|uniref:Reverse transcriptase/retrotransposon-derived protein RNase H-like domain-containing protein n=1 Tax=Solanum verrucosum TaxID=315347 RepID=A0AAF0ZW21_SOLVR|nr:hypothetical protein MTR67_044855 [Solanum verrucosum]
MVYSLLLIVHGLEKKNTSLQKIFNVDHKSTTHMRNIKPFPLILVKHLEFSDVILLKHCEKIIVRMFVGAYGPKDDARIGKVHRKSFPKNATRRATEKLFAISYADIIFATYAEYLQLFAIYTLEDSVLVEGLKQESLQLRKQNEELVKEVDHIQEGRCSDVDEVAYLKWVNACLRYELRNYQSALGETTARDLSKTLSPESSKKAKQLVVEYAAKEDQGDRGIHVLELDSIQLSSQEPHLMNSSEFDGTSISNSSAHKSDTSNKSKIFRKLMRLIRGKDHHHNHSEMAHNTEENATRCSYYFSGSEDEQADHLRIVLKVLKEQQLLAKVCGRVFFDCLSIDSINPKESKVLVAGACEKSFQELKNRLTSAPVLTLPEGFDGFVVYSDASRIGLGCVLMQMRNSLLMLQGN